MAYLSNCNKAREMWVYNKSLINFVPTNEIKHERLNKVSLPGF